MFLITVDLRLTSEIRSSRLIVIQLKSKWFFKIKMLENFKNHDEVLTAEFKKFIGYFTYIFWDYQLSNFPTSIEFFCLNHFFFSLLNIFCEDYIFFLLRIKEDLCINIFIFPQKFSNKTQHFNGNIFIIRRFGNIFKERVILGDGWKQTRIYTHTHTHTPLNTKDVYFRSRKSNF